MLKYGFCRCPSWDRGKGFGFGFGLIGGGGGLDKQAGVESGVREAMLKNSPLKFRTWVKLAQGPNFRRKFTQV